MLVTEKSDETSVALPARQEGVTPRSDPRKSRTRFVLMWFRRGLALLVCLLVVTLGFSVLTGRWELLPVLSGSMSPGMPTGSIAFAQREPISDLKLHDVAVFHPPNSSRVIYMHRVISLRRVHGEVVVRTKGDANPVPDPWTLHITSPTVYLVRYRVPEVGYVVLWVHSKTGREVILTVAGLLALGLVISAVRDGGRKPMAASEV